MIRRILIGAGVLVALGLFLGWASANPPILIWFGAIGMLVVLMVLAGIAAYGLNSDRR